MKNKDKRSRIIFSHPKEVEREKRREIKKLDNKIGRQPRVQCTCWIPILSRETEVCLEGILSWIDLIEEASTIGLSFPFSNRTAGIF